MKNVRIPSAFPYESKYVDVYGSKMHYIEQGSGDPILFLHGIPASSYIWRNIIPHLSNLGRCIAPDLIGMGKSDKPDIEYSIEDHIRYIGEFINKLGLKRIVFVLHEWGSIIGFHYAMHHEANCKALAFYESYLRPMNGESLSLPFQEHIMSIENSEITFNALTNGTGYVDQVMPQTMIRPLSNEEIAYYREPFLNNSAEKVLQTYLNELPRGDGTSKADQLIAEYSNRLVESYLSKLMLYSIPGYITTIATVMWAKENLHNLEIAEVGEELHYAQESNPVLMGETISVWLQSLE